MKKSKILLAIEAPLLRGALRAVLAEEPNFEIVGEPTGDPIDVLIALGRTGADVLIHSWGEESHVAAAQTHLFAEFPNLLIVGISRNEESGYAQCQIASMESLISFLKTTRRCA